MAAEFEPISSYGKDALDWHFPRVARALTGRKTRIVWGHTIRQNPQVRGTVRKEGEDAVIYLKTGMSAAATYDVFLHECGHVKETWSAIWDLGGQRDYFPDSFNSKAAAAKVKPLETKAISQASQWAAWAKANSPYPQIPWLLSTLEDWEPE